MQLHSFFALHPSPYPSPHALARQTVPRLPLPLLWSRVTAVRRTRSYAVVLPRGLLSSRGFRSGNLVGNITSRHRKTPGIWLADACANAAEAGLVCLRLWGASTRTPGRGLLPRRVPCWRDERACWHAAAVAVWSLPRSLRRTRSCGAPRCNVIISDDGLHIRACARWLSRSP